MSSFVSVYDCSFTHEHMYVHEDGNVFLNVVVVC